MGFKEVASLDAETTTALGGVNKKTGRANPTKAEGYFIGSKVVESKKSKTGTAKIHILQTSKGNLGIWGKTDLDRKMLAVPAGSMVRITQSGMVAIPGGNDMYKFKVEVDTDNSIDVDLPSEESAGNEGEEAQEYTSSEAEEYQEADPEAEEEVYDEAPAARATPPRAPAAVPSSASQQRVKDLLKGRAKTA